MEEMGRDNARKIELLSCSTLEECVNELLKFKNRGESVVVDFNGHQLYSCDVTMDSAYLEVYGKTKAELDNAKKELIENDREEEEEAKAEAEAKVSEWIKRGERFIYPERAEEWKTYLEEIAGNLYRRMSVDAAIEIMEKLESGATLAEAKELLDSQEHSGDSYKTVKSIIFSFSKYGPEFLEYTYGGRPPLHFEVQIAAKKKENARLAELHKDDSTKEVSAERRTEEQEITNLFAEKTHLTAEISVIELQLAALRDEEEKLKKVLDEKQSQLKRL